MTIPAFLRRNRRSRSATFRNSLRCESLESRRLLAIDITVGSHTLLPNTPNQEIEIMVTSDDQDPADLISGVVLLAQLGDGDGGIDEPNFESVEFNGGNGTIWDGRDFVPENDDPTKAVQRGDDNEPSYISTGGILGDETDLTVCANGACDFQPNGILARIFVDTTGFTSGTFDLSMSVGVDPIDQTHFVAPNTGAMIPVNLTDGSITIESSVVDRHVFYNNSAFDSVSDNDAVATDKDPLLPGDPATFANYTNFLFGVNGVMVDVDKVADPQAIDESDFSFLVGNTADPTNWNIQPPTPTVSVHEGEGVNGSDRIKIIFPNASIVKNWLQVTVAANSDTGLSSPDVFYFGNIVGDTGFGNAPNEVLVNFTDASAVFGNGNFAGTGTIENNFDMNRDRFVNFTDASIVFGNGAFPGTGLTLFTAPSSLLKGSAIKSEGEPSLDLDINGDGIVTISDAFDVVARLRNSKVTKGVSIEAAADSTSDLTLVSAITIVAEIRQRADQPVESIVEETSTEDLIDLALTEDLFEL